MPLITIVSPTSLHWAAAATGEHVSSDGVVTAPGARESTRRPRQEETVRKVVLAALETLRESCYADLTVPRVAVCARWRPRPHYTTFVEESHRRRGLPRPGAPGAVLHRCQ